LNNVLLEFFSLDYGSRYNVLTALAIRQEVEQIMANVFYARSHVGQPLS